MNKKQGLPAWKYRTTGDLIRSERTTWLIVG